MRLKKDVMWTEIQKLVTRLNGYEGASIAQLVEEYRDCRSELCLRCGNKESYKGKCEVCRWKD